MNNAMVIFLALLISLSCHAQEASCPSAQEAASHEDYIPLCLVAQEVAGTLDKYAEDQRSSNLPKLSKVTFEFKTEVDTNVGIKFSFLIFKFGGSKMRAATNDVTFTYQVPSSTGGFNKTGSGFSETLLKTLFAAGEQVKQTQTVGKARFRSLTVSLSYGVKWDVSAEGAPVLSIVTMDGTVDRSRNDVQTLTLTFGPA